MARSGKDVDVEWSSTGNPPWTLVSDLPGWTGIETPENFLAEPIPGTGVDAQVYREHKEGTVAFSVYDSPIARTLFWDKNGETGFVRVHPQGRATGSHRLHQINASVSRTANAGGLCTWSVSGSNAVEPTEAAN